MMKYVRREPEVVDAYHYEGGEKEGRAIAKIINGKDGNRAFWQNNNFFGDHIVVVGDSGNEFVVVGDWVVFNDATRTFTRYEDAQFEALFKKVPYERPKLKWRDIPGHPHYQFSDNGKVRDSRFHGTKRRTKDGDFILYHNGKGTRWSEKEIGDEKAIEAFFAD